MSIILIIVKGTMDRIIECFSQSEPRGLTMMWLWSNDNVMIHYQQFESHRQLTFMSHIKYLPFSQLTMWCSISIKKMLPSKISIVFNLYVCPLVMTWDCSFLFCQSRRVALKLDQSNPAKKSHLQRFASRQANLIQRQLIIVNRKMHISVHEPTSWGFQHATCF